MSEFINSIGRNMRSIVGLIILIGAFAYMFRYPKEGKSEMVGLITLVAGYYYLDSKNRSDALKAKLEKEKVE